MRTYPERSAERAGLDRDVERILAYVRGEIRRETNGIVVFACDTAGLFEAVQLEVPFDGHHVHLGSCPHLYPLAHVLAHFRRYAAVLLDMRTAGVENDCAPRPEPGPPAVPGGRRALA